MDKELLLPFSCKEALRGDIIRHTSFPNSLLISPTEGSLRIGADKPSWAGAVAPSPATRSGSRSRRPSKQTLRCVTVIVIKEGN